MAGILAGNGKSGRGLYRRNGTGGADLCCQGAESEEVVENPDVINGSGTCC